ncbi:MAG: hypothetical protein ACRC1T_13300 [Clostridium chrysemydis]|uniref:hypothetical protein n=1 Tax=Clostridium chrysemydis TaxID=2665504 RepID=UPI003F36F137
MDEKEFIYKIYFNGKQGTGFLLDIKNDEEWGVIITTAHCLVDINLDNGEEAYSGITVEGGNKVIGIWKSNCNKDFAALIVELRNKPNKPIWELRKDIIKDCFDADMFGYPGKKESNKEDYSCKIEDIKFDCKTELYIGKLKEVMDEKSLLISGMSGSPIYNKDTRELYGVYVGSLENEYRYDENRIVPIQSIIEEMRDDDIIYLNKFKYKDGLSIYRKNSNLILPNDNGENTVFNELSFLLLGKSGNGKSSFIKTFLKHSDLIVSTGEGRTTRGNCEYNIYYDNNGNFSKSEIKIKFLKRDEFINLRVKQSELLINELRNKGEIEVSNLWGSLCEIDAFFDVAEFGSEITGKISDIFKDIFLENNEKNIKGDVLEKFVKDNDRLNGDKKSVLNDIIEEFYGKMYDKLMEGNLLKDKTILLDDNMSEKDMEFIELCLKKVKKDDFDITYTGIVSKVEVNDRICDEYVDLFENLKINKITFIDTYGLDHKSDDDKEEVKKRLKDLLYITYPKIKNILYVRKLNSDSPEDLEYYLPTLYEIDSNIILNVIFTEADKNDTFNKDYEENKNIDLMKIMNSGSGNSAVKYFCSPKKIARYSSAEHPLKESIYKVVKSDTFARSLFDSIANRLTPYCASENAKVFEDFFENNYLKIELLFKSIINKDHIGNGIINVKNVEENLYNNKDTEQSEFFKTIDNLLRKMFEIASMEWTNGNYHRGHWKTKKKNIECIQQQILGYCGANNDLWRDQFKFAYNEVFSKMDENDFNVLFLENKNSSQGIVIQKLLNASNKLFIGCEKYDMDRFLGTQECIGCTKRKDCFQEILINTYQNGELNEIAENRTDWLNMRCNFIDRYNNNSGVIMKYFVSKFSGLIENMEKHNEKVAIEALLNDDGIQKSMGNIRNKMASILNEDSKNYEVIITDELNRVYIKKMK